MQGWRALARAVAVVGLVLARAGAAQPSYAPGCTVALDVAGATHEAKAVALTADGKIVVAGYVKSGVYKDFLVARFHPDLTLDTTFNGTGYRIDDLQSRDDEAFAVAVQFDQKIVVAGYSDTPSKRFLAFARYNRDGTPDTTFDTDGYYLLDIFGGSNVEEIRAIAIQADGGIVAVGFDTATNPRLFAMRLTKAGALDASFNGGTVSPTLTGSTASLARGVAIDPAGGIFITGEATFTTKDFVTVKLTPGGALDPAFAGAGWTSLDVSGGADSASSLVRQPDGNIVVAGTASGNVAVARYRPDGTLDAGFGAAGLVVQDLGGVDAGSAVALDSAGKIVVAGESSFPPAQFALARFLSSGGLDLSMTDDVSGLDDRARAIVITRSGELLLAGAGQGANPKLTLSLYDADGTQDCGYLFLHPTGDAVTEFASVGSCTSHASCVNDQGGDAPTGTPAPNDGALTFVESASALARELYDLVDGALPPGKVVTEIDVVAQLAWNGASTTPSAELLYQRQGFDASPVPSSTLSVSNGSFLESRFRASNLNWSALELDALQIGLDHVTGNGLRMTQLFARVSYGEPLVQPVQSFTASASGDSVNGQVFLDWLNPSHGLYDRTVIRRVPACPALPSDGVVVASQAGGLGQPDGFTDTVPVGTYSYAAFVVDAEGHASTGVCLEASPFDRTSSKVEWIYGTGISVLTTPGLRIDGSSSESTVYTVANDGVVHAVVGGPVASGGGRWPSGWKPFRLDAAAQSRPPVVPLPSSRLAVLVGAQDGRAYAIDASTGDVIWKSAKLGDNVQAAPAAVLGAFGGARDLAFVATRNGSQPNRLYALDVSDGTVVWYFDNGGATNGIGMISTGPSVDYASGRVYFTSALGASGKNVWCLDFVVANVPQPCWASFGITTAGGGDILSSPILFAGWLFVSENASGGDLLAVDPSTGADILVHPLGAGGATGFVFPRFGTSHVFASTPTTVWSVDASLPGANWSGACVVNPSTPAAPPFTDYVFVGSNEGKLFQMSASSGSGCPSPPSVCLGDCTSTIVGAPAYDVLKGMLYSGTDDGEVYAVRVPFP